MAAVARFYEKVLADPRTRPFFEGLPMALQTQKQVAFMTWAFGGPAEYKGRDLREAHAKLVEQKGLGDVHFDAVVQLLEETLRELGVAEELVTEARSIVADTRARVLGRAP
jgi:hemoglobin